mgnify:CR=1 FL=1
MAGLFKTAANKIQDTEDAFDSIPFFNMYRLLSVVKSTLYYVDKCEDIDMTRETVEPQIYTLWKNYFEELNK